MASTVTVTIHPFLGRSFDKIVVECAKKYPKIRDSIKDTTDLLSKLIASAAKPSEAQGTARYCSTAVIQPKLQVFIFIVYSDKSHELTLSDNEYTHLANQIIQTVKICCESKHPKIMGIALDCVQVITILLVLISHAHLTSRRN